MARLLLTVTHPMTARLLMAGQAGALHDAGFEVALATAPGPDLDEVAASETVAIHPVPFTREMSPAADFRTLLAVRRVVAAVDPQIVSAGTPKAGLLGMLAARVRRVPARVYVLRGLRLETVRGARRAILGFTERAAARCAHRVVCVSDSLRRRAVELGLVPAAKACVLGSGSSNGVDVRRFAPCSAAERAARRSALGIPPEAPVVGFVGRFTRDKGVEELMEAFAVVSERLPAARLLLLGDFENGDPVPAALRRRVEDHPRVHRPGFVGDSAPFYAAMDVLAFPSHREGFPNAPLEAAACGVPVVGFAATGTVDAVVDGVTGFLVPPGDAHALAMALTCLLGDEQRRRNMARAGRARVEAEFRRELVWRLWVGFYRALLAERRVAARRGVER